jgi:ubiquinone/menaquinone biosynthesis C-methylase UbiE
MPTSYTSLQGLLHDYVIAERALNLHDRLIKYGSLEACLSDPDRKKILDVGCGGGQSAIRLKLRYPHLEVTGMDLSAEQIARARHRAQAKALPIVFEVADAQNLPYPAAAFDIVFSFGSAKHWPDPLSGFKECWRVLKPGGELLVADATSDATIRQVENFYTIARMPGLLKKPLSRLLYRRMFLPARPMNTYRQIAVQVGMPTGAVSQPEDLPIFVFRTKKPVQVDKR